jgi:poly(hydroxyalkanoate) granule-associated protein
MVKKLKAMADKQKKQSSAAGLFDSELAKTVKDSAQQIWLAGMGAFAKAQAEGKQRFETLVKEGASLQKKTQSVAEEKLGEVSSRMTSMADDVTSRAGQHWDKLESIFEDRTAKALKKLGVPSSKDVQALKDRIDALTAQLATRSRSAAHAAPKTAAKKTATAKSVAKRAPRKSAGRKTAAAA